MIKNTEEWESVKRTLLRKPVRGGYWGKKHICESNLPKGGFPPKLKGLVIPAAEELRREGFMVKRPSSHDSQWHLNFNKKEEILKRCMQL